MTFYTVQEIFCISYKKDLFVVLGITRATKGQQENGQKCMYVCTKPQVALYIQWELCTYRWALKSPW